ncbi:hypothetical protein Trydic_g3433 [Trypoxylus dichotomus]
MVFRKKKESIAFLGYSLRQWALLCSIIFFIFTAIFITLSILGLLKSEYGWKLIKADIVEEELKNESSYPSTHKQIISNEEKLCDSIQSELMKTCVFYLCSWMGVLNLITVVCLLYGVITRSYVYILPWIMVSLVTFGMALFTFLAAVHGRTICSTHVVIGIPSTIIFAAMWKTIHSYFSNLLKNKKDNTAATIKAYGGYTHTLKPVIESNVK